MKKTIEIFFSFVLTLLMPSLVLGQCKDRTEDYSIAVLKNDLDVKADSLISALKQNNFTVDCITYEALCGKESLDKYDHRILAYVDIMGWSELINESVTDPVILKRLDLTAMRLSIEAMYFARLNAISYIWIIS